MSMVKRIAEIVRARGSASPEDTEINGMSRTQIISAFQNASQRGLIRVSGYRQNGSRGRLASVYVPVPIDEQPAIAARYAAGREAAVKRARVKAREKALALRQGAAAGTRGELGYIGRVSSVWDMAGRA
jgi:hypothetical protein